MPVLNRLREYLDRNGVPYTVHAHAPAYTARELAQAEQVRPGDVAKVVVFQAENGFAMGVMRGDCVVDLEQLRDALGFSRLRLASETQLSELFVGSEVGAMPPFGNLFGMPVYVDSGLAGNRDIVFQAGTHQDGIRMRYLDFENLVKPALIPFARRVVAAY
jgi:Ala-tRNA(Pro) deacylase